VRRRTFVLTLGSAPLWLPACAHQQETPLAHLYGKEWVHGAYELSATKYAAVQSSSETASQGAYSVIAQKGIVALAALQTREVPFFIRVDQGEQGFAIGRDTPQRLTFTAGMSDADRQEAQARWEKTRDHLQTDYEEIRRLNWALTTLLAQLQHVRSAIEEARVEQYRLVRQITALAEGDKPLCELPFQVSVGDYRDVLTLLLERLDDDSKRLARLETDIVTVGLTARATDAGSGSLAANLNKVLLAVVSDEEGTSPRAAAFPQESDERAKYLAHGKELLATIRETPGYVTWEKHERTKGFDQIGQILSLVDVMTGLHTSAVYQQVLDIWRGDADYFSYLKTLVKMLPGGSAVARAADQAIELTEKVRKVAGQVEQGVVMAGTGLDAGKKLASGQMKLPAVPDADGVVQLAKDGGLLNAGSAFARSKLSKQLAFLKDPKELADVESAIGESSLMKGALPSFSISPR
jgi:hypothetical protein